MKKMAAVPMKLFAIGIIIGILCIASCCIGSKMDDRRYTYNSAKEKISESAGGTFFVRGMEIVIPYEEKYEAYESGKLVTKTRKGIKTVGTDTIQYSVDLKSEVRNLGIYHAPVYTGKLKINSVMDLSNIKNTDKFKYFLSDAMIIVPIRASSLMTKPVFEINNQSCNSFFYSKDNDFYDSYDGIACYPKISQPGKYEINTELDIRGALKFMVKIGAKETKLDIVSDWNSPGFTDYEYLPDTREITDSGFSANWSIPFGSESDNSFIGFDYIQPVNLYQKLDRAQSYSFLFIIVPFIVLFLFEIFASINLHSVQYLLCGAASVIFFLLLLSFSEHLSFGAAYLIGAFASGTLVSLYILSITKKWKFGGIMCIMFILLYSYLYFCLQSEDYALLIGSIFAFILLAGIMFITRKVNWSNLKKVSNTDLMKE